MEWLQQASQKDFFRASHLHLFWFRNFQVSLSNLQKKYLCWRFRKTFSRSISNRFLQRRLRPLPICKTIQTSWSDSITRGLSLCSSILLHSKQNSRLRWLNSSWDNHDNPKLRISFGIRGPNARFVRKRSYDRWTNAWIW